MLNVKIIIYTQKRIIVLFCLQSFQQSRKIKFVAAHEIVGCSFKSNKVSLMRQRNQRIYSILYFMYSMYFEKTLSLLIFLMTPYNYLINVRVFAAVMFIKNEHNNQLYYLLLTIFTFNIHFSQAQEILTFRDKLFLKFFS